MDSKIKGLKFTKRAGIFSALFVVLLIIQTGLFADVLEDIQRIKLGIDGYFIGEKLNTADINKLHKINRSYKGTEKFQYKNLYITVAKKENVVLGLYKKFDNATFEQFKNSISFLMMKFGEPTIEAHGKTIYWFYSKQGKVENASFLKRKRKGVIEKPLVMIKFHSEKFISQVKEEKDTNSFYFIIYSEPLINKYFKKNQESSPHNFH